MVIAEPLNLIVEHHIMPLCLYEFTSLEWFIEVRPEHDAKLISGSLEQGQHPKASRVRVTTKKYCHYTSLERYTSEGRYGFTKTGFLTMMLLRLSLNPSQKCTTAVFIHWWDSIELPKMVWYFNDNVNAAPNCTWSIYKYIGRLFYNSCLKEIRCFYCFL